MSIIRPIADNQKGLWTPSTGTTLYETVDEVSVSDGDYFSTEGSGGKSYFYLNQKYLKQPTKPKKLKTYYKDALGCLVGNNVGGEWSKTYNTTIFNNSKVVNNIANGSYTSLSLNKNYSVPYTILWVGYPYSDEGFGGLLFGCNDGSGNYANMVYCSAGTGCLYFYYTNGANIGGTYNIRFKNIVVAASYDGSEAILVSNINNIVNVESSTGLSGSTSFSSISTATNSYNAYTFTSLGVVWNKKYKIEELIRLVINPWNIFDEDLPKYIPNSTRTQLQLSSTTSPGVTTGHVLRYRASGTFTATLKCGTTTIASWNESVPYLATHEYKLTTAQAALITDYSDLRIEFTT